MKTYNYQYGIGAAKHTVNYHDGEKKHKDGSPFNDIAIFKSIKEMKAFIGELVEQGYIHESLITAELRYPECNKVAEAVADSALRSINGRAPSLRGECQYPAQCILELVISKLEKCV